MREFKLAPAVAGIIPVDGLDFKGVKLWRAEEVVVKTAQLPVVCIRVISVKATIRPPGFNPIQDIFWDLIIYMPTTPTSVSRSSSVRQQVPEIIEMPQILKNACNMLDK